MIHINRLIDMSLLGGSGKHKFTTQIEASQKIKLEKNSLTLSAIFVHIGSAIGGHFVVYINCDNVWYLYDDTGSLKAKRIGNFDEIVKLNILGNATDLLYL